MGFETKSFLYLLNLMKAFNPRFLSMGFETVEVVMQLIPIISFNPRFLSMGFETAHNLLPFAL